jgi:hypothetical protein
VFIDSAEFHQQFDYLEPNPEFCQTDVLPRGNATGKCLIRVGVLAAVDYTKSTSTIQPPAAPSLLGPPNDTIPFEINPDPQQAAVELSWKDNADSGGDPIGLWLNVYQWVFLSESWTLQIAEAAQGATWTFTGDLGLSEFNCYAWRIYAVDWAQRTDPWFTPSEWSYFCTTLPGVFVDLGPLPDPNTPPPDSPPMPMAPDIGSLSVEQVLDVNANNVLDDLEILQAAEYWIKGDTVPDTDQTIDDGLILDLITLWVLGMTI